MHLELEIGSEMTLIAPGTSKPTLPWFKHFYGQVSLTFSSLENLLVFAIFLIVTHHRNYLPILKEKQEIFISMQSDMYLVSVLILPPSIMNLC